MEIFNDKHPDNRSIRFIQVNSIGKIKSVSPIYSGPDGATIVCGIPHNNERNIRVAYTRMGGQISHATLEPIASPNSNYETVKAELIGVLNTKGIINRILNIFVLPEEDIKNMETIGIKYNNPLNVLTESLLRSLNSALNTKDYCFTEDNRWHPTIQKAIEKNSTHKPRSGLSHLIWQQSHFTSE